MLGRLHLAGGGAEEAAEKADGVGRAIPFPSPEWENVSAPTKKSKQKRICVYLSSHVPPLEVSDVLETQQCLNCPFAFTTEMVHQ